MDDANDETEEAVPGLPPMPSLHTPTPPTPQDASFWGLNTTYRMDGKVFDRLFQNVVRQEARDERGGGGLKDGEKQAKIL